MAQSCDVYFYQAGLRLGLKRWSDFALECGFGAPTGLDLGGESGGLIPTEDYYNERYGRGKWTRGLLLNLAIGQGEILVTPLQIAVFMGALANGGTLYRPHLVREIGSAEGKITPVRPEVIGRLPISAANLKVLRQSLRAVVHGYMGTGRLARVPGMEAAGKTGTAQNPHGEDHAWFAGYAPIEDPLIAVAVLVEHGGHGGDIAAPIAGRIFEAYLSGKEH
jgi:penicillin-binding protein 2